MNETIVLTCIKCGKVFLEIFEDTDAEGCPVVDYRDVSKEEAVVEVLLGASQEDVYCPDCWKDWREWQMISNSGVSSRTREIY